MLAAILLPVAFVAGIWHRLMGGAAVSPNEFADILRGAAGDGHPHYPYWDMLECVDLRDPRLEALRQEALQVALPPTLDGQSKLSELAMKADALTEGHPVNTQTILVRLFNEGTDVWRPVSAAPIGEGDQFRIIGAMPEHEQWEFGPDSIVSTRMRTFSDGTSGFVAVAPMCRGDFNAC